MTKDDRPARNVTWLNRPAKSRYNLPETLGILEQFCCVQDDLAQYVLDGELRTFCCPYTHDPDRVVEIEPSQFKMMWPDAWGFPIYDNYIGKEPASEFPMQKVPLHIFPDAVDKEKGKLGKDGRKIVTNGTVYIRHDVLEKFVLHKFEAVPGGLTKRARSKGGARPKQNPWLKEAIRRIADMLTKDGIPPTSPEIWNWLCNNAQSTAPYEFDPPILGCDYLYVEDDMLSCKDQEGKVRNWKRRSLERYLPERKANQN